jgi:hypothetical protein
MTLGKPELFLVTITALVAAYRYTRGRWPVAVDVSESGA